MTKYENAIKLLEELCGNDKEELIALATISSTPNSEGKTRPSVRMVCAYYEDGRFYISTDATKNKMLEIEQNNEVAVAGMGWYTFNGIAENLGWVKDEKNGAIRARFKKVSIGSTRLATKTIKLNSSVRNTHRRRYNRPQQEIRRPALRNRLQKQNRKIIFNSDLEVVSIFQSITEELLNIALSIINSNPQYNILENGNPTRILNDIKTNS